MLRRHVTTPLAGTVVAPSALTSIFRPGGSAPLKSRAIPTCRPANEKRETRNSKFRVFAFHNFALQNWKWRKCEKTKKHCISRNYFIFRVFSISSFALKRSKRASTENKKREKRCCVFAFSRHHTKKTRNRENEK